MRVIQKLTTLVLGLTLAALACTAHADTLELVAQGVKASQRGDTGEAIRRFTSAIDANDLPVADRALLFVLRGNVWYRTQGYERAAADFGEAARLNPRMREAWSNRANAQYKLGAFDAAISDFSRAIALDPKADDHRNRGDSWQMKKDYDRAIADYDQALRLDPRDDSARGNREGALSRKAEAQRGGGSAPVARADAPRGKFSLQSRLHGKCIDVPGGNFVAGTAVQMWDCVPGHANQTFELTATHEIKAGGLCLNAFGGTGSNGDKIGLWTCVGAANEKWTLQGGLIKGINNRCINISGANSANGAAVILWDCQGAAPNELWVARDPQALQAGSLVVDAASYGSAWPRGKTAIQSRMNGRCLDVPEGQFVNGATLQLWDCVSGHPNQTFELTAANEIRAGGFCLGAIGGPGNPGDRIGLRACAGAVGEKWSLQEGQIKGTNGRCMNIQGANAANGAALILWDCEVGAPNALWVLRDLAEARRAAAPAPAATGPASAGVVAGAGGSASCKGNDAAAERLRALGAVDVQIEACLDARPATQPTGLVLPAPDPSVPMPFADWPDHYTAGLTADAIGNSAAAAKAYHTGAQLGDPGCALKLAMMYDQGRALARDRALARVWLDKSVEDERMLAPRALRFNFASYLAMAQQGYPAAQYAVGVAYAEGNDGAQPTGDIRQARAWLAKAQAQGHAGAARTLKALDAEVASSGWRPAPSGAWEAPDYMKRAAAARKAQNAANCERYLRGARVFCSTQ